MNTKLAVLAVVVLAGGGCSSQSQVPLAASFPHTYQKTVKAAHHWQTIADDTASQAAGKLQQQSITSALRVAPSASNSAFNQAFREFLTTGLVNKGVPVTTEDYAPAEITVDIQVVRQASSRYAVAPGTFTMLTAGVWVLHNAATQWSNLSVAGGLLGAAITTDILNAKDANPIGHSPTHTELIVTTSVTNKGQYVMRRSDVYYIEDVDGSLYRQAKEWKVVG
ncbi:MAG: hypothetical protein Q8O33_17695 [Pseudomonadota bacterium]|nr:hypothetical protein [Pseudomonadota bacterium]